VAVAAEASVVRLPRQDGPLDVPRTVIDLDALRTDTTPTGSGRSGRSGKPAAKRTDTGSDGTAVPPIVGRGGEDVSDWL
jgi:hypothetical protein